MPRLLLPLLLSLALVAVARATPIRVACVGDSITAGSGLRDPGHEAWPAVLGQLLGAGYEVKNFGVSGATLLKAGDKPYWKQAAFARADAFAPDIVVIALGTNDSKPKNWTAHRDEFASDAAALVAHFTALPSKPRVWISLPPPIFSHVYNIDEPNAAAIRDILRTVAAAHHLPVIDLGPALKDQPKLFRDGVHPLPEGAKVLAGAVAAALKSK